MTAWINGKFVEHAEARVGLFDAGFQHGIGLFETMLAREGAVLGFEAHLERLATSARELRLFDPLKVEPLAEAVQHALAKSGLRDARIRITLTAGRERIGREGACACADSPADSHHRHPCPAADALPR
jgi:branched-subunit amino acid aminotransferase/4-amino-4-deoxychorismate lyase